MEEINHMKSKRSKQSVVLDVASEREQFLKEAIGFEWPLEEGHSSFQSETKNYLYGEGFWEHGIRIGIFEAPTGEDILNCKFTSGRYRAIVDVYKVRIGKRGIRTGRTISYKEIFFYKDDPQPPSELVAILFEQVNQYSGWERII
jgi:hypothetical protein